MKNEIRSIWIEAECWESWDKENDNTDVVVTLEDGSRWVASFFTYSNIDTHVNKNKETKECMCGKYFWASDMILIDELTRNNIEEVINDLINEDYFEDVFTQCNGSLENFPDENRLNEIFKSKGELLVDNDPWEKNWITYTIEYNEDKVTFEFQPSDASVEIKRYFNEKEVLSMLLRYINTVNFECCKNKEYIIIDINNKNKKEILEVQIKPDIFISWRN